MIHDAKKYKLNTNSKNIIYCRSILKDDFLHNIGALYKKLRYTLAML